jgi:hypothetical protein
MTNRYRIKFNLLVHTQRRLSSGDDGPEICHNNVIIDSTEEKKNFFYSIKGHHDWRSWTESNKVCQLFLQTMCNIKLYYYDLINKQIVGCQQITLFIRAYKTYLHIPSD